jgi:hypothetical protein
MKNLIISICLFLITIPSLGQILVRQTVTPGGPYQVGDTITVKYSIDRGVTEPRYFWLRYQFNNKALNMVPNSTNFIQEGSLQTFFTNWNNYSYSPAPNIPENELYEQYLSSNWNYIVNPDWNVGQLTIQRSDALINGDFATQKYVIKDQNLYDNIHKLDLAFARNVESQFISPVRRGSPNITLSEVFGNVSQFKVRVLYPDGYKINDHTIQIMKLKNDGTIDWSQQPIAQLPLDSSGEALFTTQVKIGDSVGVFVTPPFQKNWMDDIITVSDAYKAFLGHTQTDINGTPTFFKFPNLEKRVGNVTKNDNVFDESDSYYLFAHVMGQDVSSYSMVPTSNSISVKWNSGLLNQGWLDGVPRHNVYIDKPVKEVNMVFAWGGDLDWSHSTSPNEIATRLGGNNQVGVEYGSYRLNNVESAKLNITSSLINNKVILSTTLTKEDLAGLQIIMAYDNTKLELDNILFDSGTTVTNFSTKNENRITFGSIDRTNMSKIKPGTPYKLIFTPKVQLTNTSGLFYFILSDAVNLAGEKINLIID